MGDEEARSASHQAAKVKNQASRVILISMAAFGTLGLTAFAGTWTPQIDVTTRVLALTTFSCSIFIALLAIGYAAFQLNEFRFLITDKVTKAYVFLAFAAALSFLSLIVAGSFNYLHIINKQLETKIESCGT